MPTSTEVYNRALTHFRGNQELAREASQLYPGDFVTEDDASCERCDDYGCAECDPYECDNCRDQGCTMCIPDCTNCDDRGCEQCEPDLID
jgi:hypothetical protein